MRKLIVLPGYCASLGGMTVSLSMMIKGFERCGFSEQLCVLVRSGSLVEKYLRSLDQGFCLQLFESQDQFQFVKQALQWVKQQPSDYPLLLENCTNRKLLPIIIRASLSLRLSDRPIYHMFHDLALSYNRLGNLTRNITFACLSPQIFCNSKFTAQHLGDRFGKVRGILYQPVDSSRFNDLPLSNPPENLQPILASGARLMLTPSRISEPDNYNDKNLRSLLPLLAQLKSMGYYYHAVVIGEDFSPNQRRTRALIEQAESLDVADRFTVLAPTFAIEDYYKYADIVVTLAPREPFGRTVVEAIACGVPVVGSKTGGVGEILHHFAPNWTVDPNDTAATAQAIVGIAADPNTSNILTQGQRWVETHCSTVGYARKIIELTGLDSSQLQVASLVY